MLDSEMNNIIHISHTTKKKLTNVNCRLSFSAADAISLVVWMKSYNINDVGVQFGAFVCFIQFINIYKFHAH